MKCGKCNSTLKSASIYVDRVRIPIGHFCPVCWVQITFSDELSTYRQKILKQYKEQIKSKPKFTKKQRKSCPYCLEKGIVNRSKWTIRKMKVKPDESKSWKCTCQKCGGIWTQNTDSEYWIIDPNEPKFTTGL